MLKVLAICNAVIADAVRRKVVWVVAVFAAVLAIAVPALPSYGVGVVSAVFREVSIALMWIAALVVGLALATTRIPVEVERRTVFNVISRDVRRWQYVLGSWLGMFVVLGVVLAAFAAATIGIGAFEYGEVMWRLFEGAFGVWLEVSVIMAVAIALSCQFGAITSVVGALAFAFIGHSVSGLLNLPGGARPPWYWPTLDVFNVVNPVAHGTGYSFVYGLSMVAAFVAWSAMLLLIGSLVFGRRDL
jgi:ABC-type transport system involved in multi-copper enzyme maturation permease subunit